MPDYATHSIDAGLVDAQIARLQNAACDLGVPELLAESLIRYAVHGVATGDFLRAFLANDLAEAIGRADEETLAHFRPLHQFVHNFLGATCHGSREAVDAWLRGGMTAQKVACHG